MLKNSCKYFSLLSLLKIFPPPPKKKSNERKKCTCRNRAKRIAWISSDVVKMKFGHEPLVSIGLPGIGFFFLSLVVLGIEYNLKLSFSYAKLIVKLNLSWLLVDFVRWTRNRLLVNFTNDYWLILLTDCSSHQFIDYRKKKLKNPYLIFK